MLVKNVRTIRSISPLVVASLVATGCGSGASGTNGAPPPDLGVSSAPRSDASSPGAATGESHPPDAGSPGTSFEAGTSGQGAADATTHSTREGGASGPVSDGGDSGTPSDSGNSCSFSMADAGDGTARTVLVDAQQFMGTIRSLQGAHWDPGPGQGALSQTYVAMGVDMIRTHDIGGVNGTGTGDVDGPGTDRMYPDLNADSTSEASYNFGPTDSVIKDIHDVGAEVYFRVGRSNLTGVNTVPPDFDKYADIVKHMVMHYNQGWANGFSYGIRYFEIWNEPDFQVFWSGTGDQYHDLYGKIVRAIKSVDSGALVGGPAIMSFNDETGMRASFMQYLKDNNLPLDFYSFHKYTNKTQDPLDFAREAQSFRDELDMYGFTATKIVNSEWETSLENDIILGGDAGKAAFMAEALMYMQDGPVDKSTTYMPISSTPTKETLAFEAVSKLSETPSRLCTQGGDDQGFAVLAGRSTSASQLQVVIANYQIATSLMGPIPGGNEESLGGLVNVTYQDRRTITYSDKEGYALTIQSIPDAWGDVTIKQYRIDANNDFMLVNTTVSKVTERVQGRVTISGAWAHAQPNPPDDPNGTAQGVDLIVVNGQN